MKTIIVAPHPDDEILGCAGTLLRRRAEGGQIAWIIVTSITVEAGWSPVMVENRHSEIEKISVLMGFDKVYCLNFPSAGLDQIRLSDLVCGISKAFSEYLPDEVLIPHGEDVHTDHQIVSKAVMSCTKWFRYPSIKRVMAYETLSETDINISGSKPLYPNFFINIENYLDAKLEALNIYSSELGEFPFPRSARAVSALAAVRGIASGFKAAEAFELLRERS